MKKSILILSSLFILASVLVGCGKVEPDYTTKEFEAALNNGENLEGKIVSVEVSELEPNSAFGYNIQAGEHLNFVSTENPNVKKEDTVLLEIKKVESMLGSYIISYEKK
ncbi:hypothetical protein [Aquibacillus kalidii]|uniref:hypothetical protein n=1 Tax=Aquibacillus kalidii TaxID=2762597 RepID=UPI001646433D|nr:hypothetical protein [Aquibacillus kalidii]